MRYITLSLVYIILSCACQLIHICEFYPCSMSQFGLSLLPMPSGSLYLWPAQHWAVQSGRAASEALTVIVVWVSECGQAEPC